MIGIDLGGTKIELIVLDQGGLEIWRKRVPTPSGHYEETLLTISMLVQEAKATFGLDDSAVVGIGTPGSQTTVEGQRVMKNCNSTVLNGRPFLSDLQTALHCDVRMANDANCFALAEARSGAALNDIAQPRRCVFGVILGTGVGGGVVVNGQVLEGPNSIAGEWGHNRLSASCLDDLPVEEKNRACYCGRIDCIETYLSGPGLSNSYRLRHGVSLSSKVIIEKLRQDDQNAESIWRAYLLQLASSLSQVVNILDPDIIVLGGGMSLIEEIYAPLPELMRPFVFTDQFCTPIVPAKLGDSAGVYGAAWLTEDGAGVPTH